LTCLDKTSSEFVASLDLNDVFDITAGSIRSGISTNVEQNRLYLTSRNGYLFSVGFDSTTGAFEPASGWNYRIDTYSTSTPVFLNGRIYVCSGGSFAGQEGGMYCLDEGGNLLWHNDIAGEQYGSQASPAISVQDDDLYIYVTTGEPEAALVCLDGDGHQIWSYVPPYTEYTLQGAAIYDGKVYFVNDAGYLYALGNRTAWDVNQDGSIDVLDMILVGNHFGETGDAGWIAEDVKADGSIDVLDMIIIGNHFGE
jgi:outer membrane protein assembly factor BamB